MSFFDDKTFKNENFITFRTQNFFFDIVIFENQQNRVKSLLIILFSKIKNYSDIKDTEI